MLESVPDAAPQAPPPPPAPLNLLGCSLEALEALAERLGAPAFRGRQLFGWVFARRARSVAAMANLPANLRAALAQHTSLARPRLDAVLRAPDGTSKFRFVAADGAAFEAVFIPEVARGRGTNTVCISSQTGCSVGCKFCFTASLRRHRSLQVHEIVGQVLEVRDHLAAATPPVPLTNVVFMGMGEPLLNYDNVVRAARLLLDPRGLDFSSRRVTISTAGIVPRLRQLGHDLPTQLAISLNATEDATRTRIMPINKTWPIAELMDAVRAYPLPPRRRVTIEYVLLAGVNDTPADARRLVRLLDGIPVKVNLLPLNPHERTALTRPSDAVVALFQDTLREHGLNVLQRAARGQQIAAACGQLGADA